MGLVLLNFRILVFVCVSLYVCVCGLHQHWGNLFTVFDMWGNQCVYTAGCVFMCMCLQSGLPKNIFPCDSLTEASYVYRLSGWAAGYETYDRLTFPLCRFSLKGDGINWFHICSIQFTWLDNSIPGEFLWSRANILRVWCPFFQVWNDHMINVSTALGGSQPHIGRKPFQKLLFECFHCEAKMKQPLLADNYLTLIDLNENRKRLYPMITQNVDCLRQVNQL